MHLSPQQLLFVQQLINGLSWGAIYALIAVGYTMVYGVLRLINFAHGDIYMLGAMTGVYAASWYGISKPSWPSFAAVIITSMIVCGMVGFIIERVAYRPLRNQPRISALITAIGVSMFLEYGGQGVFGATPKTFPNIVPIAESSLDVGGVSIDRVDIMIVLLTLVLMAGLTWIVLKTKTGLALRAVSYRFDTAALMGVDTNRIISFTFILGSMLAAAGGVMVAVGHPRVDPLMGLMPGIKAFVAAVLGGIGSIPGAVVGGFLLGTIEVLVKAYVPQGSQYCDAIAFVILIAILLVKPTGLFGRNLVEKSDASSLSADPRRWWLRTLRGNVLVLTAICIAAWVGFRVEYLDRDIHPLQWFGVSGGAFHYSQYQAHILMLTAIGIIMAVSLQLINGISGQFSLGHAGFMAVGAYFSGYASATYSALDPDDPATNFQNVGQVFWYLVSLAIVMAAVAGILAIVFFLLRESRRIWRGLPPVLMLAVMAWFTYDFSAGYGLDVLPAHLIWTKLIRTLGAVFDWSLAHGMPPAKAFSLWLPPICRRPLCMIVLLSGGGFFAAVAGLLVGLPTLRLRGDYLAIATLGFAEILTIIFINSAALGGATGLSITPYYNAGDPDRDPVTHYICPWILALMVVTIVAVWRIAYSPKGRLIRAVREDEIAAAAVGINNTRQKVTAFVVGAFFAGIGGVLYIHLEGYVHPEKSFGIDKSLLFVVMVTLGGLGSISGAIVAGAILTLLPFFFRQLASAPYVPHSLQLIFQNQLALFALALIVMMLVRPRGLLGGHELWFRRRRSPRWLATRGAM